MRGYVFAQADTQQGPCSTFPLEEDTLRNGGFVVVTLSGAQAVSLSPGVTHRRPLKVARLWEL